MKLLKILAGIGGAAIAAIGVTGGTANAAASPWTPVYLHAFSGNGCASYATIQRLAPITSERCTASNSWFYRDLTQSSLPPQLGDKLEFVDFTKTYALGFSGGQIKLETPDANSTYVVFHEVLSDGGHNGQVLTIPADKGAFIYPNGAGLPLQLSGGGPFMGNSTDSWTECPTGNPTCG
jgi:hypothetical protein